MYVCVCVCVCVCVYVCMREMGDGALDIGAYPRYWCVAYSVARTACRSRCVRECLRCLSYRCMRP